MTARWEYTQDAAEKGCDCPPSNNDGCVGDFIGNPGWPGAAVAIAFLLLFVADMWVNDRDDARLDQLRETSVEACADRTESVEALGDCVSATIKATGQPS